MRGAISVHAWLKHRFRNHTGAYHSTDGLWKLKRRRCIDNETGRPMMAVKDQPPHYPACKPPPSTKNQNLRMPFPLNTKSNSHSSQSSNVSIKPNHQYMHLPSNDPIGKGPATDHEPIHMQKPISTHLYSIRNSRVRNLFDAASRTRVNCVRQ